jgi:hypothetical protein
MTAFQELLPRLLGRNGESGDGEEPAPAQAARKVLRSAGIELPASWTPILTQVAHWTYGIAWGAGYSLVRSRTRANATVLGLGFGLGVWGASYAQLVPLGIYEPLWRYPPSTLAEDASYHVIYGLGVAAAYSALPA